MTENVQCPVCTLYLHAGMNLSDHLETHPKEQVIRALVQMTISGAVVGNSNTSTAESNSAKKSSTDLEQKPLPSTEDNELKTSSPSNTCNTLLSNSFSNFSLSNQSVSNSQNLKSSINFSDTKTEQMNETEPGKISTSSTAMLQSVLKAETATSSSKAKNCLVGNENVSQCFSKQNFNQNNSGSNTKAGAVHSFHQNSIALTNVTNNIHNNFNVFGCNARYEQQQRNDVDNHNQVSALPHMPPPSSPAVSQSQHLGQHQEVADRGIVSAGSSGTFHTIQAHQLPPPPPPHHASSHLNNSSNGLRQTHMFSAGQPTPTNSHHAQSLKVIYTPNLPPPPPLQLFTYQPQTHLQHHQKPPPAYGTAISQIRSQNNQSKHQVAVSLATQHQHQTVQSHSVLQQQQQQQNLQLHQNLQPNLRMQVPPPQATLPISTKHAYSPKNNDLPNQNHAIASRHSQSQQHDQQSKTDLSQHQQQQEQQQPQANSESSSNSNNPIFNPNEVINKSSLKCASSLFNSSGNVTPYPQVSISTSTASTSVAAVAASTLGRHTNSPFAALLAAAAGAPSPSNTSSVLRYAESPVAHYLERENGDFIVQETPKHIVECVETDNGEFSVIERIYQSPPSVLHIHDDDDDNCEDRLSDEEHERSDVKSKQNILIDSENEKPGDELEEKKGKSLTKDSKTNKPKRKTKSDDQSAIDNEIVDFVSISSDSGDEEEFISQEQKDPKNISDKGKKKPLSTPSMSTTSSQSLTTSSSSSSSSTGLQAFATSSDNQSTSSSSSATLHTSSIVTVSTNSTQLNTGSGNPTNNTASRKKSSKNTITVLSDVQLNLNEYLDLVGNIIASSKVAAQRKTFASIAPMPLVKIEKEEPLDEYIITNATTSATAATLPNFETAPPLMANKLETEEITNTTNNSHNKQTINNHNIVLSNELVQDEQEEKKPQVFSTENETSIAISTTSAGLMNSNSSHVTSVIRMATTIQHQQQEHLRNSLEENKNSNEAEDLSQPQQKIQIMANSKALSNTPLSRKGPKKLIIKPKSTKTEALPITTISTKQNSNQSSDDQEMPTTSAKALEEYAKEISLEKDPLNTTDIKVKNEPITSITYENLQPQSQCEPNTSFSILEQHLSSKEPILEFKEEKPCITEASLPPTSILNEMKIENNVTDDARVLYNFANSKKSQNEVSPTFPSSASLFSSKQINSAEMAVCHEHKSQQPIKDIHNENEASSSSSSTYSSQSAMDASLPPGNESSTNVSASATGLTPNQNNPVYSDFHFNYLYNSGSNNEIPVAEQEDIKSHQQFASFYQNSTNSNHNTMLLEDSSSSKHYADYQQLQHNPNQLQQQHTAAGTSHDQWFNNNSYQIPETNVTPISSNQSVSNTANSRLSLHGNAAALDCTEGNKYLDLDSCKREKNIDSAVGDRGTVPAPPPPSSSTSCSFNGTTDNSMAGICSTTVTLNIRTDEKMPAKGEISEQESNCDIDNSWSQPMYGDISARFFKTTFPGIFPQDNGWNQEEYFSVQDLSASTTGQGHNNISNRLKSYETTNSSNNNNSTGMPIFSQSANENCNIDVMPSTSAKIRKRRKRGSQDGKTSQANGKRMQPTSTVTSQQMLTQHQNETACADFGFHHQQQHNLQQHLQQPTTSTAFLGGSPSAGTALATGFLMQQQQQQPRPQQNQIQQKQRTKVYECGHCNAKYSKLKDRNAHMIDVHNYIRQNRRLVCPTTGLATPLNNSEMQDVVVPTTSAASSMVIPALQNDDCMGDYKQGIVKIENENPQRDLPGVEPINANLSAKTEIVEDDKKSLALVTMNAANVDSTIEYDSKLPTNGLPLSLTTPTSKLITLYRMLVSFNMTTLKQHQSLSEFDENIIKSSVFFCYICRQNFNSVKFYDAHLTEHPAECFTCGKKFQRWKNFSLHLKRHLGWKEFGCTVCDKKFVVRSALVEHTRMHSGLSPLKCKVCGKHFKRYSNLTQHRKRHTKQIVRRKEYVCYCGEVLPSKARFLWHKETHDSKPKCCPHCCDRFVHVNSLRRHIRLAHSDKFDYTEPMECPICKQIFAKASMKAHMATHSTDTQYDCAICNKSFSTKWNLKIHSWVHANRTAKPFKCEHCPKAFVREVDFKNHMNSHKQIKPYTCEVCGCKFIRKYNYIRHRREHHGNKKYTCDLCKKSFHRHYYLIEHRRIHTGERPFQCSICGKSSTTKTNHNKHLKIHHSRDPFTVEV